MSSSVSWFQPSADSRATNFVFLGEAGSGKSELALCFSRLLARQCDKPTHLFDLDMTKPLFRSRDLADALEREGIALHFEEQFMDAPTTTGGVRRLLRDNTCYTILDVGGDHIGARAVGGYASLLNQPNTAVYYVINPFRPWSARLEHIDRVLGETLGVSHLALNCLRLVGNPNLGPETTAADVLEGARSLLAMVEPFKPIAFFCVSEALCGEVAVDLSRPLLPIRLSLTYPWDGSHA